MKIATIDELIKIFSNRVVDEVDDKSWISVPIVTDENVKTRVALVSVEMDGGKAMFIGDSSIDATEMTLDDLEDRLHELEIDHGDAECYSRYATGNVLVPIYDIYAAGGSKSLAAFRADYSEFDKSDKRISEQVSFTSDYMNKTLRFTTSGMARTSFQTRTHT